MRRDGERRPAGASSWRRLELLLTVVAVGVGIVSAAAAYPVTTQDELQSAIDNGERDIIVMGLIPFDTSAVTIDSGGTTGFMIRGGTTDAGFEGLGDAGQGLFDIQTGANVTFAGLSFSKGYNSDNGGCVAITGAVVVFNDAHFFDCAAGGFINSMHRTAPHPTNMHHQYRVEARAHPFTLAWTARFMFRSRRRRDLGYQQQCGHPIFNSGRV